ncbi:HEAT repeat domain-containing protein [Actinoplanes flavus]|uniref:HEAT repeat domain-containing protein n=1 Tax=Actinoplanes flavus TaxID=2820290 RepID=UPI001ABD047B|nr:HEAT repeat domain-containing protein [Actinoplanes flavus]
MRADRDGLMTHRLLTFVAEGRARIRRVALELLDQLCFPPSDWPLVADAAERALDDVDPSVRLAAARLLVKAAEPARAMSAFNDSADPIVRTALMEVMPWQRIRRHRAILERLRTDPVAAIRFLANIALLGRDESPVRDAAIRADLEASIAALNTPGSAGQRWAWALAGVDREEDCCLFAERLTDSAGSESVRLEGVRMAAAAMCEWRAAPARVTPMLIRILQEEPSGVRAAALDALAASVTASRLAADELAALADDPHLGATAATALGSAGDHRAMPHLVRLLLADSDQPRLTEAFRVLARAGADPEAPVTAARRILATHPHHSEPERAMRVLAAFGPGAAAAVPELIVRLQQAVNDTPDWAMCVLGRIGPAAAAAIPYLREYPIQAATHALLEITLDRAPADRSLANCPERLLRHGRFAMDLLNWLAGNGGLTARQHRQLRSLFETPGSTRVATAGALWLHEGPAAAEELLEVLPEYLSDDRYALAALRVLTAMGPHAGPILDRLDRFVAARQRTRFHSGARDAAAMRMDEALVTEAMALRQRLGRITTC